MAKQTDDAIRRSCVDKVCSCCNWKFTFEDYTRDEIVYIKTKRKTLIILHKYCINKYNKQ